MRWLWGSLICCLPTLAMAAEPVRVAGLFMPEPLQMDAPAGTKTEAQTPQDRWGRPIVNNDKLALSLLAEGRAQIQPEDGTTIPASWWAAERTAQRAQRGLWAQDCCRLLSAEGDAPDLPLNVWRVVAGRVTAIKTTKAATYVNFSATPETAWTTDFSLKIAPRLAKTLKADAWVGQTLQVRGFISWSYGPSIEVIVPDQVEILPEAAPTSATDRPH